VHSKKNPEEMLSFPSSYSIAMIFLEAKYTRKICSIKKRSKWKKLTKTIDDVFLFQRR
jgi:hypothetical protein